MRRRVTRRLTRLLNYVQRSYLANNDEIMYKNQFTGTATQPQCNRIFRQFNNNQYCTCTAKWISAVGKKALFLIRIHV